MNFVIIDLAAIWQPLGHQRNISLNHRMSSVRKYLLDSAGSRAHHIIKEVMQLALEVLIKHS